YQKLATKLNTVNQYIDAARILYKVGFKSDDQQLHTLWKARNGVLPTIAAQRHIGSSVLIEDTAVNILVSTIIISDVKEIFVKYKYTNADVIGHVLDGNIHFGLTHIFHDTNQLVDYDKFMHELNTIVAKKY
ncbi:FAD-linked oxidase C-terminal domain-containing protein, partial [Francisella tularensis]|uniref:FAD-linked oxidase C-terminal domain-containing protein n=1 Tax=Francisella tularensis TaxID=263 RepID=UPI00199D07D6